jgi:hypothetical protein
MTLQIGALFWSLLESKTLFFSINIEFNFSGSDINVSICGTQEGSPMNERCLHASCMSSTTKSIGTKKFWIFTEIFSVIPAG